MSTGLTKSVWLQFSTSANFLLQSLDARGVALGESYVAVAGGIHSLYWNPAGLSALEKRIELTFTHRPSISDDVLNYEQAALAYPLNARSALAIDYTYVDFGYPSFDPEEHQYSYALGASYAIQVFRNLSAGLTLRRISQELILSEHAFAVDLGALYQWQNFWQAPAWQSQLNFGASLSNLGEKVEFFEGQADPLPRFLRLGVASQVMSQSKWNETGLHYAGMLVSFEYQNLLNDHDVNGEKIWEWGAGAELQFVEMVHLRLDYHKRLPQTNRTAIGRIFVPAFVS
ncbi:MAG: PorV/PorQ family protein [bacterium]